MDSNHHMPVAASIKAPPDPALPPGFSEFYSAHYDFVWRCALRLGVATHDVDDIVQEVFVVVLRRFAEFDPSSLQARPTTWLFAVLRNIQRNHARSARRRAARVELYSRASEDQLDRRGADASLARRLLDEFLATLDEDKRAAFVLADIEGMTGPELARALELNLNTANSRVRAARRAFARHFDEPRSRELARTQIDRSARARAPKEARNRGLPILAALSGSGLTTTSGAAGALGVKLIAGLIFAAACAGAAVIATTAEPDVVHSEPKHARSAKTVVAAPRSEPVAAATIDVQASTPIDPPAASERPKPARPRPTAREPKPLDRIAQAHEALRAGQPQRALALVEGRRFSSALEGRRVAIEVAALCRLERHVLAQSQARAWRTEHPDDPTSPEMVGVCWSE